MRALTLLLVGLTLVILASLDSGGMSIAQETHDTESGPPGASDDCGEVPGVEVLRDLPGLEDFGEAAGIRVCKQGDVTSHGVGAASGFIYNGREVDPATIPVVVGTGAIDTDMDNCSDADELALNMDPNNYLDWPDYARDGVIDALDAQSVAFRWGLDSSDEYYSEYFDRGVSVSLPPNGSIDIHDLQIVFGYFGYTCPAVIVPRSTQQVCNDLAVEAAADGVYDFTCSTVPLPDNLIIDDLDEEVMIARVTTRHDGTVFAATISGEVSEEPGTVPPPEANAGGGVVTIDHPSECDTEVCRVTLKRERDFYAFGIRCAEIRMTTRYKVYAPWAGVFAVLQPSVTGDAWGVCDEESLEGFFDHSVLPFEATHWYDYHFVAGVPTPWGRLQVRSWSGSDYMWFNGLYEIQAY